MSIFIVRPKVGVRTRSVSLSGRRLTLIARKEQINEIIDLNRNDATQEEIQRWLSAHKVQEVTNTDSRDVLGLRVVQMTPEEATQLGKDLTQAEVIQDRPIDLIRPEKSSEISREGRPNHLGNWQGYLTGTSQRQTGQGVTVAVLDTGVDESHPEFAGGRIAGGYTFDLTTGVAIPQTPSTDTDTHGTHVAGLICGRTVGIAPGAKVLNGVMIPGSRGTVASFIIAMGWAATRPDVQIVHLSAGLPGYVPEMRDAVGALRACGVLTVAAIGNDGRNMTRSPGNFPEVLSVGSFGEGPEGQLRMSSFSSTGNMMAESHSYRVPRVFAPGENIRSCVPGGSYDAYSGTSMAAPQISGVAARILERDPTIQLVDLLAEIDELQSKWFVEMEQSRNVLAVYGFWRFWW